MCTRIVVNIPVLLTRPLHAVWSVLIVSVIAEMVLSPALTSSYIVWTRISVLIIFSSSSETVASHVCGSPGWQSLTLTNMSTNNTVKYIVSSRIKCYWTYRTINNVTYLKHSNDDSVHSQTSRTLLYVGFMGWFA